MPQAAIAKNAIDPLSIIDIKAMVKDLKERDIGVFITDHNVHEMVELVDRRCR
jgi:lipopolysaccharide export system ATP-binding protein